MSEIANKNEKRIFQVLDELNVRDGIEDTRIVGVCTEIVNMRMVSDKASVEIGVPNEIFHELVSCDRMAFLVLVDWEEYKKAKGQ